MILQEQCVMMIGTEGLAMFNNEKIIAIIPARGGSKGIKNKNIYPINGKPLVYWTVYASQMAECIDKVIIATDSEEIKSNKNEKYR